MASPELTRNLARNSANPQVTQAIWNLQDPGLRTLLAENDNLPLDQRAKIIELIKTKMIDKNPTVATMAEPLLQSLCDSAVGDPKITQLLMQDALLSTRLYLSASGLRGASDEQTRSFIKELTPELAYLWLISDNPPAAPHLKKVAKLENGVAALSLATDRALYTTSEVQELLGRVLLPKRGYTAAIAELIDTRPDVLPDLITLALDKEQERIPATTLFTFLATCRHIFDQDIFNTLIHASKSLPVKDRKYSLLAAASNPNIDLANLNPILGIFQRSQAKSSPSNYKVVQRHYLEKEKTPTYIITSDWATLTNQSQMDFITEYLETASSRYPTLQQERLRRPLPSPTDPIQRDLGKLYLIPTSSADILAADWVKRLSTVLASPLTFQDLVAPLLDPLGQPGYELFFALANDWKTTVSDLVEVVTSTLTR